MRIALDATYSVGPNLSGVGVYSNEILARLPLAHPESRFLFCYRPHRLRRGLVTARPGNARPTLLTSFWPRRVHLFHALNQRVAGTRYPRVVTTFHDLFVLTSEYSSPDFRARFSAQAKLAAERSDLLIAVSHFTAGQLETLLKVPASRIRVVHHGISMHPPVPPVSDRRPMILFVGAIQKRKNVVRLVQAFEATPPDWKLVLAGSAGFGFPEILDTIQRSPRRADIEVRGYVSAADLARLYSEASIFAFPSLDEGFGMPVLEAMAYGIPVLTSNSSALAEISGDAALVVDPHDQKEIGDALRVLIESDSLRARLVAKAHLQCAKFSWEDSVRKTWEVYEELL